MKKKILHITMSLNIGGAETHIVEVAKSLKNEYDVVVASGGGVYVSELEKNKIKHFEVPLDTKKPHAIIKSIFKLIRIVKKEKVDLIHSHARIPGFVGGIVSKLTRTPFVTTTHGHFKVNTLLRFLSNWGERSIAVSSDLKDYLIKEYGFDDKKVYLSVNGIDLNKFKKDKKVKRDKIVHVSRLDDETSLVATELIKNCKQIYGATSCKIKIVGSGTKFDYLKQLKQEYDPQGKYVHMVGATDKVEKELRDAKVFVGVSRSLLEAMCYDIPVVLACDVGFGGLVTKQNVDSFRDTNFSGRKEKQLQDIIFMKSIVEAVERADDYDWTRKYIDKNYSIKCMVEPYFELYRDMFQKGKKYVISGYYGYKNSGDDALLSSVIRDIKEINEYNQIFILSKNHSHYEFEKVELVNRFSIIDAIRYIRKSDVLIMGGGSLLQDTTSNRSLYYYLSIIFMGNFFKKKTYLYSNGVGPISGSFNRYITAKVLNKVSVITFRDKESYELVKQIGVNRPELIVTADSVFSLDYSVGFKKKEKKVAFVVRNWEHSDEFCERIAQYGDYIAEKLGYEIVFVPLKNPDDILVSQKVASLMFSTSKIEILDNVKDIVQFFASCYFTVSMRFHGVIYSSIASTPAIGISYDKKVDSICEMLDLSYVKVENIDEENLEKMTDDILDNYEKRVMTLSKDVKRLKKKAKKNKEILKKL